MLLSVWTLFIALVLSVIAGYYSVIGLATIFSAIPIPVIIMSASMEVAKVTAAVWLHHYWPKCKLMMRIYLILATITLCLITSMGVFGLLSRAHADQGVLSADKSSQIAIIDEKIKIERDNIEYARQAIAQMNVGVDQTIARSTTENSVGKAVQIRKSQAKERTQLQKEIDQSQTRIKQLNDEKAPLSSELRKFEAEVGPIKYIAAMVYNENPDAATLERAVRWVIIMLVIVFDPLAITLVLAANESFKWNREDKFKKKIPLTLEIPDEIQNLKENIHDDASIEVTDDLIIKDSPINHTGMAIEQCVINLTDTVEFTDLNQDIALPPLDNLKNHNYSIKNASKLWKALNPNHTFKEQRKLVASGELKHLPWEDPEFIEKYFD